MKIEIKVNWGKRENDLGQKEGHLLEPIKHRVREQEYASTISGWVVVRDRGTWFSRGGGTNLYRVLNFGTYESMRLIDPVLEDRCMEKHGFHFRPLVPGIVEVQLPGWFKLRKETLRQGETVKIGRWEFTLFSSQVAAREFVSTLSVKRRT